MPCSEYYSVHKLLTVKGIARSPAQPVYLGHLILPSPSSFRSVLRISRPLAKLIEFHSSTFLFGQNPCAVSSAEVML